MLSVTLALAFPTAIGVTVAEAPGRASDAPPATVTVTTTTAVTVETSYHGVTAHRWAARFKHRTHQLQAVKRHAKARWAPTVDYALRLASAVYGVPYSELRSVAWCESRFYPFAHNGQYLGIFQMHWSPFGFSPFDPVASALSAAQTVRADGSWRQWECKP